MAKRCKMFRLISVHVDEIKMIKRRGYFEGARRTTFNLSSRALRYVDPRPAERINVIFFQPPLVGKSLRVSRAVILHNFKLKLRPNTNLIKFQRGYHVPASKFAASCLGN